MRIIETNGILMRILCQFKSLGENIITIYSNAFTSAFKDHILPENILVLSHSKHIEKIKCNCV